MTYTNINSPETAVSAFQRLNIDDRLAVLALLYTDIAGAISAGAIDSIPTQEVADLIAQVQLLSPEEQLFALRDLLPAGRNDQDEVMLDPHPSQATVELAGGGTTIPTGQYGHLNTDAKIAFWYLLAQRLGNTIIGVPNDYRLCDQAGQVLNALKSMNTDDLVSFLKKGL